MGALCVPDAARHVSALGVAITRSIDIVVVAITLLIFGSTPLDMLGNIQPMGKISVGIGILYLLALRDHSVA